MADAFQEKPRWYRLTPGHRRSVSWPWKAFCSFRTGFSGSPSTGTGWSVLIAAAAIAVTMFLMSFWFLLSLIFKWRFQFSIRSLLVLVVVVAIPCSWFATASQQARKQREAVAEITNLHGVVFYDYQLDPSAGWIPGAKLPVPPWPRKLLGGDLFARRDAGRFMHGEISDAEWDASRGCLNSNSVAGRTASESATTGWKT